MKTKRHFAILGLSCGVALLPSVLGGCTGLLAYDDVAGDNCAVGPAALIQPLNIPNKSSASRYKIYIMRGLLNAYSLGLDRLKDELDNLNLDTKIVTWPEWQSAAEGIVQTYQSDPNAPEIILIGHSYGGTDAANVARELAADGVPIRLVFLLDATSPAPITSNVEECIAYYIPTIWGSMFPFLFAGNPPTLEPGNTKTVLTNKIFDEADLGPGVGCANHFSIDVNVLAHDLFIEEVLKIVEADAP
jgi:hypothetical protein